MSLEIVVVVSALFSFIAAIASLDLAVVRDLIGSFYVLYGFIHFPYKIEDRIERPGIGTASAVIALLGGLSFFTGSWWYLTLAPLGYLLSFIVFKKKRGGIQTDTMRHIVTSFIKAYHTLSSDYADRFSKEEDLLKNSALVNLRLYIDSGLVNIGAVDDAMYAAKDGKCHIGFAEMVHETNFINCNPTALELAGPPCDVEDLRLNYIMQMVAIILRVEHLREHNDFGPHVDNAIVETVISKKKHIKNIIDETLNEAAIGNVDPEIKLAAHEYMTTFLNEQSKAK